jgi:NADH-quinone oxidoreductase subunit H
MPLSLFARLLGLVALLCTLVACQKERLGPQLDVIDVQPRDVDVGDRIEVLGTNLPAGEGRTALVIFEGELRRPGQPPLKGQEIRVEDAHVSSDKVSMVFTEGLQTRFCGRGDDAVHTTFSGDVTVQLAAAAPDTVVEGRVRGVTVDFIPPTPRRAVIDARETEGRRAVEFLGIELAGDSPAAGGLMVSGVRPASPADRAQILSGDLLVSF